MRITEYPSTTELDSSSAFIIDGDAGSKQIVRDDLVYALFHDIPEMHRKIPRGKDLGSALTSEQQTAIAEGTFDDLWIGDYWTSDNIKYVIVDLDYFYGLSGVVDDTAYHNMTHHVVIMPDRRLSTSSITGEGGTSYNYLTSVAKTSTALSSSASQITSFFGSSHIMQYVDKCCSAIYGNATTGDSYYWTMIATTNFLATIEIPEIYYLFDFPSHTSTTGNRFRTDKFALFDVQPRAVYGNEFQKTDWGTTEGYTITRSPTFRWYGNSTGANMSGYNRMVEGQSTFSSTSETWLVPFACIC